MIVGFSASSSASQLGPQELPGVGGFVLWDSSQLGGRLLHCVGMWQEEPVASLGDIAMSLLFPDKIYSLGGAEEIFVAVTGSCLAFGFCSTSSFRKINGNIPLAEGWLGSRHTVALHSVCGSCQHSLT